MSRGRFGLLLALLVLVLGTATFVVVLEVTEDDPPEAVAPTSTSTSTTTTAPGGLVTPTFVAIVSSEGDEPSAQAIRDELTESGYDAAVLHSDDFTSLEPGFWVAYVGPFDELDEAEAAKDDLVASGRTSAYTRCVGTAEQCE